MADEIREGAAVHDLPEVQRLSEARGAPVIDGSGDQIGHVGEVWYDDSSGRPEWLKVGAGFLGMKTLFVPVQGGELREDGFYTPYTKDQMSDSAYDEDVELDDTHDTRLRSAYGLDARRQTSDADTDQAVTRHEEELAVGKQEVQGGTARLRKWVETEPVQMDVELQKETARVTREPLDEQVGGGEIGEEEIELRLREERAVVGKQTVAKERIGLEKDVQAETQTVGDEVRREHVEVEGDTGRS